MTGLATKNIGSPDEVREMKDSKGRIELVDLGPGDFMTAAPGHDGWVIGDETCVMLDWQGMADYAKV